MSNPQTQQELEDDGAEIDDDENAMDWTPTDPRAAASRRRKNKHTDENVWLRPQTFFAPEKPTGLESLFARTKIDDDAMMVDSQEEVAGNGPLSTRVIRHFKRWWWIYATVIVPVIVAVVVRRVWRLEITIAPVGRGSESVETTSPSLLSTFLSEASGEAA